MRPPACGRTRDYLGSSFLFPESLEKGHFSQWSGLSVALKEASMTRQVFTREILIRHRGEILRRSALALSIAAGAAMWAFTMIRIAGVELS